MAAWYAYPSVRKSILIYLMAAACVSAAQPSSLGTPIHEVEIDPGYTTVFMWDARTIAVLNPTTSEALLLRETAKGWTTHTAGLEKRFPGGAGTAYPDVVRRRGDNIYWLSRRANAVGVFKADGGKFERHISTGPGNAFFFDVLPDGGVEVFVTAAKEAVAEYRRYDPEGKLVSRRPGWLTPLPRGNELLNTFFFEVGGGRVELAANFAHARSNGASIPLASCKALPKAIADHVRRDEENRGLPVPIGRGYRSNRQERPFILAAAASDHTVYAVAAGSVLYEIGAGGRAATCRTVPPPRDVTRYFHSSVAANETSIAVLTRYAGTAILRVWRIAKKP